MTVFIRGFAWALIHLRQRLWRDRLTQIEVVGGYADNRLNSGWKSFFWLASIAGGLVSYENILNSTPSRIRFEGFTYTKGRKAMFRRLLFLIFVIIFTATVQTDLYGGSVTIVKNGASISSFTGDQEKYSLEESEFPRGVKIGDGPLSASATYHIMLPEKSHLSGNQLTYLKVQLYGAGYTSLEDIKIGGVAGRLNSSLYCEFNDYASISSAVEVAPFGWANYISVEIPVGILDSYFDLEKIEVTYTYSGVSEDVLLAYQEIYGAWGAFRKYRENVVEEWDVTDHAADYFYVGCQEALALADNLWDMQDQNIKDALDTTSDCIENFQNMATGMTAAFDFLTFNISYASYGGPEFSVVESKLEDAEQACETFLYQLYSQAFDGGISEQDSVDINTSISNACIEIDEFEDILGQLASAVAWSILGNPENESAQAMFYSLSPMFSPAIALDTSTPTNTNPKYTSAVIDSLNAMHFDPPVIIEKYTYAGTTFGDDYIDGQITNPRTSFTYPQDFDKICMAIRLEDVYKNGDYDPLVKFKWDFYRPDGTKNFGGHEVVIDDPRPGTINSITYVQSNLASLGFEDYPGEWSCKIYVDDEGAYELIDDIHFDLINLCPFRPINPTPAHGSIDRPIDTLISWSNGGGATSYDVYFGTDSSPDSTEWKGEFNSTSYDPGTLEEGTTYYWRIDAKNSYYTTTGYTWHFSTITPRIMKVFLWPQEACQEGAKWSINGTNWYDSGYSLCGIPDGNYTVLFQSTSNWKAPSPENITINYNNRNIQLPAHYYNGADINKDDKINMVDYSLFSEDWLATGSLGDIDNSGVTDINDLSIICENWLIMNRYDLISLSPMDIIYVGETFVSEGINVTGQTFTWTGGVTYDGGNAIVDGTGNGVWLNNINLLFDFSTSPVSILSLNLAEGGGNENLEINGDFYVIDDIFSLNGYTIGGATVTFTYSLTGPKIIIVGDINSFSIGGQELAIDNIVVFN